MVCLYTTICSFLLPAVMLASSPVSQPTENPITKHEITIYWYATNPFIYKNKQNKLHGIEYEILESFIKHLNYKRNEKIVAKWTEIKNFSALIENVHKAKSPMTMGNSAISYVAEREAIIDFTPPYMPDINVLLVSNNIPVFHQKNEIINYLKNTKLFTIENTTYQTDLQSLVNEFGLKGAYVYLFNDSEIISALEVNKSSMAYCGLPFYIKALENGTTVKRQNLFQINRDGFRFIMHKDFPFHEEANEYFESEAFKIIANQIINKYLGESNNELIWEISEFTSSEDTELAFLRKEKEVQDQKLINAQLREERQQLIIIASMALLVFLFGFIFNLLKVNRRRMQINTILKEKQRELESLLKRIEDQNKLIEQKNQMLRKRNHDLKDLNDQKKDLIGVVSHDLKSPINQIQGLVAIYKSIADPLEGQPKEVIDRIEEASGRLKTMVERILDIEAAESKQIHLNLEEININDLLSEMKVNFEPIARQKQIETKLSLPDTPNYIMADREYLLQVLENLISNAIKFSPPQKEVTISIKEKHNQTHICIADQGPGISESDQKKLFGKFQKLTAKPTGEESSTGLGLSIVKKYVLAMERDVWCESAYGKGATFIVAFDKLNSG